MPHEDITRILKRTKMTSSQGIVRRNRYFVLAWKNCICSFETNAKKKTLSVVFKWQDI